MSRSRADAWRAIRASSREFNYRLLEQPSSDRFEPVTEVEQRLEREGRRAEPNAGRLAFEEQCGRRPEPPWLTAQQLISSSASLDLLPLLFCLPGRGLRVAALSLSRN